jgi:hypothetical protein
MVLAPKQTQKPMEQTRRPQNKLTQLWPSESWQRNLFGKWCWENQLSTCRRLLLDPYLLLCVKINSKQIKYLNIRPQTLKLLHENIWKTQAQAIIFWIAQEIRASIDKWDFIKLKWFCTSKEQLLESRDNPQNGRISLQAVHVIKDWYSDYIKSSKY